MKLSIIVYERNSVKTYPFVALSQWPRNIILRHFVREKKGATRTKKEEKCFRTSSSSLMHTKAPGGGSTCEVFADTSIGTIHYLPLMPPVLSKVRLVLQKMNWICPFGMSIAFLTLLSSSPLKFSPLNSWIISHCTKRLFQTNLYSIGFY